MPLAAKNYSDDFFKFNYFTELQLIKLYGDYPRNWFSFVTWKSKFNNYKIQLKHVDLDTRINVN